MIAEFPLPEEIELLHSKPAFAFAQAFRLPASFSAPPTLFSSKLENPIGEFYQDFYISAHHSEKHDR
ncbi:unnamed protein product, partial [Mesorhabditis spiculigera]